MPSFLEQDYNAKVPNPQAPTTLASAQAPVATAASFATAPAVTVPQQKANTFQGAAAPKAYLNPRDPKSPGYIPPNYQLPPVKLPTNHYVPPTPATNVDPNISVDNYGSGVSAISPGVVAGAVAAGIDPATLGNYDPAFLSTLDDMSRPETAVSKFFDATLGQALPITSSGKLGAVFGFVPAVGTGIAAFQTVTSIFGRDEQGNTLLDSVKDTIFGSSKGKGKGKVAEQAAQRGRSAPPVGAGPAGPTPYSYGPPTGAPPAYTSTSLGPSAGVAPAVTTLGPSAGVAPGGYTDSSGSDTGGSDYVFGAALTTPTRVGYMRQSGYDFEAPTASELGVSMFGNIYGMGGEISQNFAIGGKGSFTSFGHYAAGISQADEMGIVSRGLLGGKNRAFMTPEEGKDVVDAMVEGGHSEDVISAVANGQTNTAEITALAKATGADDAGVGGDGGSPVICTQLFSMGIMSANLYQGEGEHAKNIPNVIRRGYHFWAVPFVRGMRKNQLLFKLGKTLGLSWAQYAAHKANPDKFASNHLGTVINAIGIPICATLGLFVGETNWESLWIDYKKETVYA